MNIDRVVSEWLTRFNEALGSENVSQLGELFSPSGYWRNIVGLERGIRTVSGRERIGHALMQAANRSRTSAFTLDPRHASAMWGEFGGKKTIDARLRFETAVSSGVAHVRLDSSEGAGPARAWTLTTAIDELKGHDLVSERLKREGTAFERDWRGPNWSERRKASAAFADRDPKVLIVGGGHAGLTTAAWLNALNIDNLVVDRNRRVGDNWRHRYNSLKLHSPTASVHFPFLSYPPTWPKYIPKDKIANWMEFYVDAMEINYWPDTEFEGARYNGSPGTWEARLKIGESGGRIVRSAHIVLATSQIGTPNIPRIAGLENFKGKVIHSSQFEGGRWWPGRRVLVIGTGTSAHDIAQELHAHGAKVTMVQRGVTEVIQIEPSAHMYLDALFELEGPSLEEKDLLACTAPLPILEEDHRRLTRIARANDADLLDRLERAGFKVERNNDGIGWPMKYFTRNGGYYFNVGCSDLIAAGEIGVMQYDRIESFAADGPVLRDGRQLPVDLIVLATGYEGYEDALPRWFGEDIAQQVGRVWGIDPDTQELCNMWAPTAQPGLWFAGGSFVHSRIYSKYVALQIKAEEEGLCR